MKLPLTRVAFLSSVLAVAGCATGNAASGGLPTGKPITLSVADLSGEPVNLGAQHGKVLLVDMWATWCEPCKQSLPFFEKLSRDYSKKGLALYAISFDEKKESIAPFLKNLGVSVPTLWDGGGEKTSASLGVVRLPTTLLVDRTGTVRYAHEGFTDEIAAQERQQIESLLAE